LKRYAQARPLKRNFFVQAGHEQAGGSDPAELGAAAAKVGVRVEEEDMCTGVRHHCCSAYLTFVSVLARGGAGRPPRALPRLAPTNRLHSAIYEAAEQCGPPRPSEHSKAAQ